MPETLRDLLRHEAWADAKLLRALGNCRGAWDDSAIQDKLHHSHGVQMVYLTLIQDQPLNLEKLQRPFCSFDELRTSVLEYHSSVFRLFESLTSDDLERAVVLNVPGHEARRNSVREAFLQVVTHSHYHRAQLATRLRELGGDPPLTDFIVLVWGGRPEH
jgi:uncharacterized damage-inducible protein DinB